MPAKSNKFKTVVFEFESEEIAHAFLAYMSDGGGECGFTDHEPRDGGLDCRVSFDYHTANDGKFGPVVRVTADED